MPEILYVESADLKDLAIDLRTRYYVHLGHVEVDCIYFAEKQGEPPQKHKTAELNGVTHGGIRQMLARMGGEQNYCLHVWQDEWNELQSATREWLMFEMLYGIGPRNDGRITPKDVNEYGPIAEFFANHDEIGLKWRGRDGELPSLLSGPVLPIPLPPNDEEDDTAGSTL